MANKVAQDSPETVDVDDSEFTELFTEANLDYQDESEHTEANMKEKVERLTRFPMSRIRLIMKTDPEVLASQDAVFLISKATELFIQALAKEAYSCTVQNKKKIIRKKDVDSAVANGDNLVFLEGALDT